MAGYDEISPNIVKTVFNEVFSTIRNWFNISLQQGFLTAKLKIYCVTPISKNGDNLYSKIIGLFKLSYAFQSYLNVLSTVAYMIFY